MSTSGLTRRQVLAGGVVMAAAGGRAKGAVQAANPPMYAGVQIVSSFDGGLLPPVKIEGDTLTFDLKGEVSIVNVLVRRASPRLRVRLLLGEKTAAFIAEQGLVTSRDGLTWAASPLTKADDGTLEATIEVPQGEIRIATRYPYGRDGLDRLLCDTRARPTRSGDTCGRAIAACPCLNWGRTTGASGSTSSVPVRTLGKPQASGLPTQ